MYIFPHCTNRGGGLIQSVELSENTAYASGQQRGGGAGPGYAAVTKETPAKSTQESAQYDEPFVPPTKTESPPEYAVVQKKKKPEEPPADEGDDENVLVFEDD